MAAAWLPSGVGAGLLLRAGLAALVACGGVPVASPSSPSSAEQAALLDQHNRYRTEVGVAPLTWSPALAASAQRWADHLSQRLDCELEHEEGSGEGENLAFGLRVLDAPAHWYEERSDYDGSPVSAQARGGNWQAWGHYSQMVWSGTRELGCGAAACRGEDAGYVVTVCRYLPAGNIVGRRAY